MSEIIHCNIAIIGGGAGGLSLAAGAAQLGLDTVLLEGKAMGGDCLNYGCVPSKALLAAAKRVYEARNAKDFGYSVLRDSLDFNKVMLHVANAIKTIAVNDSIERFTKLGVRVISETALFRDKHTVYTKSFLIKAKYFVIASGSSPVIPPISGLAEIDFMTNETIFSLKTLPHHLIVIGGGAIGVEMSQAFAMLGSRVTLLEGLSIMGQDDRSCVDEVRKALKKTGVDIFENTKVKSVAKVKDKIKVIADNHGDDVEILGSHLLVAVGRKANINGLNCDAAGVKTNVRGVNVDGRMRTSNKRVYALGDAVGQLQFTHVANAHAGIILKNIAFKIPARMKVNAICWVTYTEPQLAHAGLTESQCIEKKISYTKLKFNYCDNDRAVTERQTQGFIEIILGNRNKVVGVNIVGHNAGDLILPWVQLIREKKSLRSFTDVIVAYPTLSEISKRVVMQHYAPKLFSAKVQKLVKFLNWVFR